MKKQHAEPADIKIFVKGKGVVVNEKGLIALNKQTKQIAALGNEAVQAETEDGMKYDMISPFHQGRVADFTAAQLLFKFLLHKVGMKRYGLHKPNIMICVPADSNPVEKKAYEDAVYLCGAKTVSLCIEPFIDVIQHIEERQEHKAVSYIIGITKDEPIAYVKEALEEVIEQARAQGLDKQWMQEYIEK